MGKVISHTLLAVAIAAVWVATSLAARLTESGIRPTVGDSLVGIQTFPISAKFDKSFAGTIGSGLRVRMDLSNDNGTVHGQYFYEKIGTPISLDGKIFPKGDFSLSELNDEGKPTGHFTGTAAPRSAGSKTQLVLTGTWSSADGSKNLPFSLSEEVVDPGPGLEVVSRPIKQESKKPKYDIDINYPQITGTGPAGVSEFNHEAESLARKTVADFKKDIASLEPARSHSDSGSEISMNYEVTLATPDLISVLVSIGEYSAGAAHPNGFSVSINYALKSNRKLALTDLFLPGKPYLSAISRYSIAKLKSKLTDSPDLDWINRGAGPKLENYKNWNMTSTGLEITFDDYQVASHAEGPQLVFIPYSELKSLINPDGPLAGLVH
jgi:hypothetical protein